MRWRAALAETTASSNPISLALASDKKHRFISRSCLGREPPHPNTQSAGYDECYHAYPHGCVVGSDRHLGMVDQSQDVTYRKEREHDARYAQSSFL